MPILHSFEENKLEYEDEDEVKIKMMRTGMDKESLEHNLYENDIILIIFHNFSPTSNPPIKPKDSGNFMMKVVEPLTIHTPPSPHIAYLHRNEITNRNLRTGIFEEKKKKLFTDLGDGVKINLDGVARPATGKFNFI
ncbi:hypothetical protein Tco_0240996 [Tanacetum coccineum]